MSKADLSTPLLYNSVAMQTQAILPKKYTDAAKARDKLNEFFKRAMTNAQKELQTYPEWRPWKNPPRTGRHAGGKRTGDLGRNWSTWNLISGQSITMENKIPYAPYVQGKKGEQARALAARGWPRIDEVGQRAVKKAIVETKLAP